MIEPFRLLQDSDFRLLTCTSGTFNMFAKFFKRLMQARKDINHGNEIKILGVSVEHNLIYSLSFQKCNLWNCLDKPYGTACQADRCPVPGIQLVPCGTPLPRPLAEKRERTLNVLLLPLLCKFSSFLKNSALPSSRGRLHYVGRRSVDVTINFCSCSAHHQQINSSSASMHHQHIISASYTQWFHFKSGKFISRVLHCLLFCSFLCYILYV